MSFDVFLSYSWDDRKVVDQAEESLAAAGVSAFIDRNELRTGDELTEEIRRRIRSSHVFVGLVSESWRRKWGGTELGMALATKRPILPFLLSGAPRTLVPELADRLVLELPSWPSFAATVRRAVDEDKRREGSGLLTGIGRYAQVHDPLRDIVERFREGDRKLVGRHGELGWLHEWLESERQNLLLLGPAGRGKSALLYRLCRNLNDEDDGRLVCWIPASMRAGIHGADQLLLAAAARLQRLLDLQSPIELGPRAVVNEALRGETPLVFVIDGIDEVSAPGELRGAIPEKHPAVKVIIAARGEQRHDADRWRTVLGWDDSATTDVHELEPLDEASVSAMVAGTELAKDLGQLMQSTGGDPLLVELAVAARTAKANPVDELFKRWLGDQERRWEDQGNDDGDEILPLLAAAVGPLEVEDLGALLDGLTPRQCGRLMSSMTRLVARTSGGWVLIYRRFADRLREVRPKEVARWERRLEDWVADTCRELAAAPSDPDQPIAPYAARHMVAYLARKPVTPEAYDAPTSVARLASILEGDPSGATLAFDLQAALSSIASWNREHPAEARVSSELRCLLSAASLQPTHFPTPFFVACVAQGWLTPYEAVIASSGRDALLLAALVPWIRRRDVPRIERTLAGWPDKARAAGLALLGTAWGAPRARLHREALALTDQLGPLERVETLVRMFVEIESLREAALERLDQEVEHSRDGRNQPTTQNGMDSRSVGEQFQAEESTRRLVRVLIGAMRPGEKARVERVVRAHLPATGWIALAWLAGATTGKTRLRLWREILPAKDDISPTDLALRLNDLPEGHQPPEPLASELVERLWNSSAKLGIADWVRPLLVPLLAGDARRAARLVEKMDYDTWRSAVLKMPALLAISDGAHFARLERRLAPHHPDDLWLEVARRSPPPFRARAAERALECAAGNRPAQRCWVMLAVAELDLDLERRRQLVEQGAELLAVCNVRDQEGLMPLAVARANELGDERVTDELARALRGGTRAEFQLALEPGADSERLRNVAASCRYQYDEGEKVEALFALWRRLEAAARDPLLPVLSRSASAIPDPIRRFRALAALHRESIANRDAIAREAIAALHRSAGHSKYGEDQERFLLFEEMGDDLSPALVAETLPLLERIANTFERARALRRVGDRLAVERRAELVARTLGEAEEAKEPRGWLMMLATLAPWLEPARWHEAIKLLDHQEPKHRAAVAIDLLSGMPESERLEQAREEVRRAREAGADPEHVRLLAALAGEQAPTPEPLAAPEATASDLYAIWSAEAHVRWDPRRVLLSWVAERADLIEAIEGQAGLVRAFQAIVDVTSL